jgi:hypothetical protein
MKSARYPIVIVAICGVLLGFAGAHAHEDEQLASGTPERLGQVDFPVSCTAPAQAQFNRGVAILHSFYYPAALKAFSEVTRIDPGCVMGYWGMAMASWYPLWFAPTRESLMQGRGGGGKGPPRGGVKTRGGPDKRGHVEIIPGL